MIRMNKVNYEMQQRSRKENNEIKNIGWEGRTEKTWLKAAEKHRFANETCCNRRQVETKEPLEQSLAKTSKLSHPSTCWQLFQMHPKMLVARFCCKAVLLTHAPFFTHQEFQVVFGRAASHCSALRLPNKCRWSSPHAGLCIPLCWTLWASCQSFAQTPKLLPVVTLPEWSPHSPAQTPWSRMDKFLSPAKPQQRARAREWALGWQL